MLREEINMVKDAFEMHHDPLFNKRQTKNAAISTMFRLKGNELYDIKNHDIKAYIEICKLYTQSIAWAPNYSEELSLGYESRSSLSYHLRKYEECIKDVEEAYKISTCDESRLNLYCRKVECLAALRKNGAGMACEKAIEWLEEIDLSDDARKKLESRLQKVVEDVERWPFCEPKKTRSEDFTFEAQMIIPCASTAVSVEYNAKFGRHLVATRDIKVGEILAIEKSYHQCLHREGMYILCTHCLKPLWAGVPCGQCIYSVYCSEDCKLEAWYKYHDIECFAMTESWTVSSSHSVFKLIESNLDWVCMRMIVQAVKEAGSIGALKKLIEDVELCKDFKIKGCSKNGVFQSESYKSIYSVLPEINEIDTLDGLTKLTVMSKVVTTLHTYATHTSFFGDCSYKSRQALIENEDILFIGALLLRHLYSLCSIVQNVEKCLPDTNVKIIMGGYILPFCSLFNHSCDPNATGFFMDNCKKVMYARYPIKKGEQIFDNYGFSYHNMVLEQRQNNLKIAYNFNCTCKPCTEKWPLICSRPVSEVSGYSLEIKEKVRDILSKYQVYMTGAEYSMDQVSVLLTELPQLIETLFKYIAPPALEIFQLVSILHAAFKTVYGNYIIISL